MNDLLPKLAALATGADMRVVAMLVFLAFLLTVLAWKLVEGLAAVFFKLLYSLTPQGRLAEKQRREAIAAEVEASMAKINSLQAQFQGPPQPPAHWQIWLRRMGPVAYVGVLGLWSCSAWHFYQLAQTTAERIAEEEARNPLMISSLRGLHCDEPGKTYAIATFLALQVLAVLTSSFWQWYKDHQPTTQNPLPNKPLA